MQIKTRIICIQFTVIICLSILLISLNQKSQVISPLANPNKIAVLGDKIAKKNSPTIIPSQTLTPTPSLTPTLTPSPIPTATPTPSPSPTPTPTAITTSLLEDLFSKYSSQYSVAKDLLKKIANCESGFNPNAASRDYLGLFQFAAQTWINARTRMGQDPNADLRTNAEESIKTAAFVISEGKTAMWPSCSK